MVVGLVLELEKPFFCRHFTFVAYDVHIHIYAACIVFFTDLHVVEKPLALEVACTDSSHIHKVQALVLTAEFLADLHVEIQRTVYLILKERLLDIDVFQFCSECSMTAVIAPICIQDTEFCLKRVTTFCLEIVHHFAKVVCIHCQTHLPAIWCEFLFREGGQAFKHRYRGYLRLLHGSQSGKVLLT